jgi:hypothetical protein
MLTNFDYNGIEITRRDDGYYDGSAMCKANEKLIADWLRLKSTKAYIQEMATVMGIPIAQLVDKKQGNFTGEKQGTWIHPSLAINLTRWISPQFAVWCDAHIFNLINTGSTSLDIDPIAKMRAELCSIRADILNETNSWDKDENYYLSW